MTRRLNRRQAIATVGAAMAGVAGSAGAAQTPVTPAARARRAVPRAELVNILEYGDEAKRALEPAVFTKIAGSDRSSFDRMTLKPRMMVPAVDLDLSLTLFGSTFIAPIIAGPIAYQGQFHPDGERATIKGAAAAG